MNALLRLADLLERTLKFIADLGAWAFIACIAAIAVDVITRKAGYQLPGFGSTRLQELEWHLHAVLFCTWIGYTYVRNGHVRIDVFITSATPRKRLWLAAPRWPSRPGARLRRSAPARSRSAAG